MAFTYWIYPTRRFSVSGMVCAVSSRAKTDGLHSRLLIDGAEMAHDFTPNFGEEAVRNQHLSAALPDGSVLAVELGYIGLSTTGIVARRDGDTIFESHPGKTPAYPEEQREAIAKSGNVKELLGAAVKEGKGDQPGAFQTGIFAKHNRLPFAIDVITGLLFYIIAKMTDLQTAAMVGIVVGFGLIAFQAITKIDVTGGLALFGIVMLTISAGLAWYFADDEWVKLRGTITGLIAAAFFIIDGLRGGHYIGRGLARYMPYSDIIPGRMAFAMGLVGIVMALLNYAVAKLASTDIWLFYKTFVDFFIVAGLAMFAIRYARKAA